MMFFKQYFKDYVFDGDEVAVRCPFPHKDEGGIAYLEERPSAHINIEKGTFHCKVCGEGYSETKFLSKINGISYREAKQLISEIEKSANSEWDSAHELLLKNQIVKERIYSLGITDEIIRELQLGYTGSGFSFPVFMYGELLDVRTYNPSNKDHGLPKVMSRAKAQSNLIIPFDVWLDSKDDTYIMAGEKDMALARSLGYNAITFTGGEQAFPKLFKASFKGKRCFIIYDNDEAGKSGARKAATLLKEVGAIPYVVEAHHEITTEKGGDFWDYIMKYGKTKEDFDRIIDITPEFSQAEFEEEKEKIVPTINIMQSTKGYFRNKIVRSSVQVTSEFDSYFPIADFVEVVKTRTDENGTMQKGDKREWSLDASNIQDILMLMDSNLTDDKVQKNLLRLCGIPSNEKFLKIRPLSYCTIFKASVTDIMEAEVISSKDKPNPKPKEIERPLELTVYTVDKKLQAGMKYKLNYKLVNHPLQAQMAVGVVTAIEKSDDTVSAFQMNEQVKKSLKVFQGEPFAKMRETYDKAKGIVGSHLSEMIFYGTDLVYHTPLEFKFGKKIIKSTMDAMIVGESRTGKSSTAEGLLKMYGLGAFTTLKNASIAGLVGGSNKVGGSFKTMIGTIPRNHEGLVIFEEFSGAPKSFINTITDIRSSGTLRLTRVSGETTLNAYVRMLTLSNQRPQSESYTKPLRAYPNGVAVLTELIGAAEDIARYDYFIMVEKGNEKNSPLDDVSEPYEVMAYRNRVRWVWSRASNQIKFADGVERYIVDRSDKLNEEFDTHIQFFGNEAWKKIAKVAVAVAGCTASMDETGEYLIVHKEHVKWAISFMLNCYDNDLFRLRQYVVEQRRYAKADADCIYRVQELYAKHTTLLSQMEMISTMSQRNLQAISGMDNKEFSIVMNEMAGLMLFQWAGDKIIPSERFRASMRAINRDTHVKRIGEV